LPETSRKYVGIFLTSSADAGLRDPGAAFSARHEKRSWTQRCIRAKRLDYRQRRHHAATHAALQKTRHAFYALFVRFLRAFYE
jgi:hypothetical protein